MRAIPTRYAGTQFRSRLEARWAAMFDLLRWPWEYEPLDCAGYLPDFRLWPGTWPLCVAECRPVLREGWEDRALEQLLEAGFGLDGRLGLVLGSEMMPEGGHLSPGSEVGSGPVRWAICPPCGGTTLAHDVAHSPTSPGCIRCGELALNLLPAAPGIVSLWREAGNRVQWRAAGLPAAWRARARPARAE